MHEKFMREAIALAREKMLAGEGGPFGAVIVKDGAVIGRGWNQVTTRCDPTAHAEVVAIRNACAEIKDFALRDCVIYTSCEPCPMCLGAMYWARLEAVYLAGTREDAAAAGFSDAEIYEEISLPLTARTLPMRHLLRTEAQAVFAAWSELADRIEY